MEINRERRIKDGTEKGEGSKEGKENILNFLWKANNKVGPEMTNAPYLFWSLLAMILGRVFTDFEWPLPASFGTLTTLSINMLCSAQLLPSGPILCEPMDYSLTGSSRQEYWSGLPCPSPGDCPNPGVKPASLNVHLLWQEGSLPLVLPEKPWVS